MQTDVEHLPSTRPAMDGPGRLAHSYGSESFKVVDRRVVVNAEMCTAPGRCGTYQVDPGTLLKRRADGGRQRLGAR
jgi:hypothetical protein